MFLTEEPKYYDRAIIAKLRRQGFHLTNDLVPLHCMLNDINKYRGLSPEARKRISWFDYLGKTGNVCKTCRHFGISRKTFYKWKEAYDPHNLWSLEDRSRAPRRRRQREITMQEEERVVALRKRYIRYSKFKLKRIYQDIYHENISSWKIQKVIEKHKLYHQPVKTARIQRKRKKAVKKKRITELKRKPKRGFLLCLDTVELRTTNVKRYVFTAIDRFTKVAFARMYRNANSYNAADFLNRLLYLSEGRIENIQTDNGSEFEKCFERACRELELQRYYSRPRTPKDNAVNERFNRTLQDEFVSLGNMTGNTEAFNRNLTQWLIEYNFRRPHEALGYETPLKSNEVSPMYPSSTEDCGYC